MDTVIGQRSRASVLNHQALQGLSFATKGTTAIYVCVLLMSLLFPVPWETDFTIFVTAAACTASFIACLWVRRAQPEPGSAHTILFLLVFIMALQTGSVLFVIADPLHSTSQILVLLAVSFFITNRFWFYASLFFVIGCWAPAAFQGFVSDAPTTEWQQWTRMMVIAGAIAVATFESRRRAILENGHLSKADLDIPHEVGWDQLADTQPDELAAGVAHEFNNQLAIISGNVELLRQEDRLPHHARARLKTIMDAVRSSADCNRKLLIYAGHCQPSIRQDSLSEVVRDSAATVFSWYGSETGIDVSAADDIRASFDKALLQSSIVELLKNAVQATEKSKRRIFIRCWKAKLNPDLTTELQFFGHQREGAYVFVEVIDNGAGMDRPTRQRMFRPFFTTKPSSPGLGLSLVAGVLRSHSGCVCVDSRLGSGTRIEIAIPTSN